MASDTTIFGSSIVPFRSSFSMWAAFYLGVLYSFAARIIFGIAPRTFHGLIVFLCAPYSRRYLSSHIQHGTHLFLGAVYAFSIRNLQGLFFRCVFLDQCSGMAICPARQSYWCQRSSLCPCILSGYSLVSCDATLCRSLSL